MKVIDSVRRVAAGMWPWRLRDQRMAVERIGGGPNDGTKRPKLRK